MYVYIYIFMYLCMYIYVYIYVNIHIYILLYLYIILFFCYCMGPIGPTQGPWRTMGRATAPGDPGVGLGKSPTERNCFCACIVPHYQEKSIYYTLINNEFNTYFQ